MRRGEWGAARALEVVYFPKGIWFVEKGRTNGRALSPSRSYGYAKVQGVTVKVPELVTVPPVVVMAIFPVIAPVGTVAVT